MYVVLMYFHIPFTNAQFLMKCESPNGSKLELYVFFCEWCNCHHEIEKRRFHPYLLFLQLLQLRVIVPAHWGVGEVGEVY